MAHLVKIYSKDACPYCVMAESKAAQLKESGDIKDYVVYKLNKDFGLDELLELRPDARTFPQIFLDDHAIGGWDDWQTHLKMIEDLPKSDDFMTSYD
tara:strand:- start:416 stop:706 length:291 start_codon:yes stop_codon:yes gene_type:complete